MKRIFIYMIACLSIALMFTSCEKDEESFDETLLYGEWISMEYDSEEQKNHEVHYEYLSSKTGKTWDITEDVQYENASTFEWTLVKSDLTHIHIMEGGGQGIPKSYTVTELTATTLKYEDRVANPVVKYSLTKKK
ncbi:MAG: hypothetical protein H6536_06540 [Bacteroidales bacterium]|nr:hypothetical protein [Bacteroidales bacterium]